MKDQRTILVANALDLARVTGSHRILLFLNTPHDFRWFLKSRFTRESGIVLVVPAALPLKESDCRIAGVEVIRSWSGNQSRFSRIKYAFLHCVQQKVIRVDSRVVCVLGPWGKSHLDTITVHDLSLSWSEDFPFDPLSLVAHRGFDTIMAVIDIALDIGAMGREGSPVGTAFIIGDTEKVLTLSHQAVFNPFRGYSKKERLITRPEVVESIKELSKLDGAFIISDTGAVEAAGRHLDARSITTGKLKGFGSRHRSAAGITRMTGAIAVVVSESTGRVTVFEKGHIIATLEPVISRRLE
ncbi:MAG: diadenylate cyclase [Alphaproteobacteria bacterium]|uniref:Diadenylate cyclase n=1 Tax=Candidatus Nitrobium versatile TaxID=2884831 RepID=A0A953M1U4_9BACT|nr:diadenylate cyclase [Candidatus Nitrobium versatile]